VQHQVARARLRAPVPRRRRSSRLGPGAPGVSTVAYARVNPRRQAALLHCVLRSGGQPCGRVVVGRMRFGARETIECHSRPSNRLERSLVGRPSLLVDCRILGRGAPSRRWRGLMSVARQNAHRRSRAREPSISPRSWSLTGALSSADAPAIMSRARASSLRSSTTLGFASTAGSTCGSAR
jgi:hypothetical protein